MLRYGNEAIAILYCSVQCTVGGIWHIVAGVAENHSIHAAASRKTSRATLEDSPFFITPTSTVGVWKGASHVRRNVNVSGLPSGREREIVEASQTRECQFGTANLHVL